MTSPTRRGALSAGLSLATRVTMTLPSASCVVTPSQGRAGPAGRPRATRSASSGLSRSMGTKRLPGTALPNIDFVALARGQGCRGASVNRPEDLRDALANALKARVPMLVEVDIA